jgi:NtrC-family two-component system response regulator AlgB
LFGHVKGAFTGATSDTWGKVAIANGGTLFLDEIGELPSEIQAKLLRLLQEREYERVGEPKPRAANVRLIAATNRNLEEALHHGTFRPDLYYRLNVITVRLPPLRERPADLMRLADGYREFFASQCAKRVRRFSPPAAQALATYSWPGNLRELRNVVERAVILGNDDEITVADLPDALGAPAPGGSTPGPSLGGPFSLADIENEHIRQVVRQARSLDEAARTLGINPATLYRKRKRFDLGG